MSMRLVIALLVAVVVVVAVFVAGASPITVLAWLAIIIAALWIGGELAGYARTRSG